MRTNAHEFFEVHAVPNLEAWFKESTDMRLAMNAVVSLYHMADHFWHAYSPIDVARVFGAGDASAFRSELAKRHGSFRILRDVAEAYKHMELDRSSRLITQADQTAIGATGWGEAPFSTGPFGGGPSIIVTQDDGTKCHLSHVAQAVKQLWICSLI